MSCGCFEVKWSKLTEPTTISWKRFCETLIDLVAFNAADGVFLTKEGYTILVKINQ